MSNKKQRSLKVNALLNGIKQSCSIVFPLITFPYISRVLGKTGYGQYSFSASITGYFTLLAALGINSYAIREGAKIRDNQKNINQFCSEVYTINIITVLISYSLLALLLLLNKKVQAYTTYILIQSIAMILTAVGADWINSIYEDYFYLTVRYIVIQILSLGAMFAFVHTSEDLWKYCLIMMLSASGGNLINIFYVHKRVHLHLVYRMNLKKHIIPLLIFFVNTLAITIYVNSDITMLGFFKDDQAVGIYSFSSKIYNMLKNLINAVVIVSIPRISYILESKPGEYKKYLQNIFNFLSLLLFPVVAGMLAMSRQIIYIAGGEQYLDGTLSLQILSLATIFAIYSSLFTNCVLIVNRQEKKCLQATTISALINIGLNFILIPKMGMNGAAITTVIAEGMNFIIQVAFAREFFDFRELNINPILPIIDGSIIIFVVCLVIKRFIKAYILCFMVSIVTSVIVYFGIVLSINNIASFRKKRLF